MKVLTLFPDLRKITTPLVLLVCFIPNESINADDLGLAEIARGLVSRYSLHADMQALQVKFNELADNSPRLGKLSALFIETMHSPLNINDLSGRFATTQAIDSYSQMHSYLGEVIFKFYASQYDLHSECEPPPLPLPETLPQALQQIQHIAQHTHSLSQSALSEKSRNYLARNHQFIFDLLSNSPYPGEMEKVQISKLRKFIEHMASANFQSLQCAGLSWLSLTNNDWLQALKKLMELHPNADKSIILSLQTEIGEIILGGRAESRFYSENLLFIADLGGDDYYALEQRLDYQGRPQLIIDFSGDDIYESSKSGGYGAGVGSVSVLIDFAGNDIYQSTDITQGSGVVGIGMLLDLAGDDQYRSRNFAQGGAFFGIGVLVDLNGEDSYHIGGLGQGLGLTNGYGVLIDHRGDDSYLATGSFPTNYGTAGLTDSWAQGVGLGLRGVSPGGIGVLLDHGGSDQYNAGSFSQGGGYFLGAGILKDMGEDDDIFWGARYNMAWGAHGGIGYFYNEGGDDRYNTRNIVAAGLAWDQSLAFFHDRAGDDIYNLGGFSLGASAHGSIALFLDEDGSDTYLHVTPGESHQGAPNLSLFIDIGEKQQTIPGMHGKLPCTRLHRNSFNIAVESITDLKNDTCDIPILGQLLEQSLAK